MSNEPMLQQVAAQSPAAEPRSDAETMQAALLRMKAAARQPEAIERLRAELDKMREVIANVRAALLFDSDPSALLDDLDAWTERAMAAVIGGMLPAAKPAAATPAEESSRAEELLPAQNFSPAEAFSPGDEPPALPLDEQALLDALRDDPAAETAQAPQAEATPQAETAPRAESDHVPTVSEVFSQLGLPHADGPGAQSDSTSAGGTTTIAMLELMVEELTAAMSKPAVPKPAVPKPAVPMAPPPDSQATELISPPQPNAAEPDSAPAEPATQPPEPAAEAEVPPDPIAAAEAHAPQEPLSAPEAHARSEPAPPEPKIPEVELLSSFARMETMPFLPPEVGTAVIFESRVKSDTTAEGLSAQQAEAGPAAETVEPQPAARPEPSVIMPPVDLFEPGEPEASPQPDTPPEQTLQASAAPEPSAEPPPPEPVAHLDLDVLLFETQFEADDPAATLLEPAWPAQDVGSAAPASAPAAAAQPATQQPQEADPLAPLKAMSDKEKIALFE